VIGSLCKNHAAFYHLKYTSFVQLILNPQKLYNMLKLEEVNLARVLSKQKIIKHSQCSEKETGRLLSSKVGTIEN